VHGGSGFEVDNALSCGLEDEERIKSIAQALCDNTESRGERERQQHLDTPKSQKLTSIGTERNFIHYNIPDTRYREQSAKSQLLSIDTKTCQTGKEKTENFAKTCLTSLVFFNQIEPAQQ